MTKAVLAVLLGLSLGWAGDAAPLDADTLDMVKAFLKMPTADLPTAHISRFMAVDPEALPKKLRQPYEGKRLELRTLVRLAEGKKRGVVRMPEADCSRSRDAEGSAISVLLMAGYQEISFEEEKYVEKETRCTERDLMCEFSLVVVVEKKGKPPVARARFFLHFRDPLFAIVGQYREGHAGQTHFFGLGVPTCAPRLK